MNVRLEIYEDTGDRDRCWQLARRLARICYYLNNNSATPNSFVNGGVWGKRWTGDWNGRGVCLVVNGQYTIDASSFLYEDRMDDADIRGSVDGLLGGLTRFGGQYNSFSQWTFIN
jgi:hypothetical protein